MVTTVTLSFSCNVPTHWLSSAGRLDWGGRRGAALSGQHLLSTADPADSIWLAEKYMPLIHLHCQIFVSWGFYPAGGLSYFMTTQREAGWSDSWLQPLLQQTHLHLFHLFALSVILLMTVTHCTCNCDKLSPCMRWLFGDSFNTIFKRTQDS